MNNQIAVGLDIGTTKIVVLVGRKNEHNKVEVLGVGKAQSLGVKRGVVNNIIQTIDSIKIATAEAEEKSGIDIQNVIVGIAGQHIRSLQHSDYITRNNKEDEVISEEDLEHLENQVHKLNMQPGEEIIHVLPQEYKIDGEPDITEPCGMFGNRVEANFHVVVGQVTSIRNIGKCVKSAGLHLSDISLEPIASAEAVLSTEEKEAGVALVDIGGGTTDIAIFKNNIIRHTAVIPYGGNIITDDIKAGCSIIEKQAELLKIKFGSAWPGENKDSDIVTIPGLRGREPKEISLRKLSEIIHARVIEILQQVYYEIKSYGHEEEKKKLICGIVLTGGGAQLKHIRQLTEYVTGMDTRIGFPNEHLASGTENQLDLSSPIYATSIGLLIRGLESESFNFQKENQKEELTKEETSFSNKEDENPFAEIENKVEQRVFDLTIEEADNLTEDSSFDSESIISPNNKSEAIESKKKGKKFSYFDSWGDAFRKLINDTE